MGTTSNEQLIISEQRLHHRTISGGGACLVSGIAPYMENESKRFRHQAWRIPDAINLEAVELGLPYLIVVGVFSNPQLSANYEGKLNEQQKKCECSDTIIYLILNMNTTYYYIHVLIK